MEASYVVEMRGITKRFPGILANDHVNLSLKAGEIHALLGENGAGKSTLMSILSGSYHADEGSILIRGREERINSPNRAHELGIGMVHQHFQLIGKYTVTENIMLGAESRKFGFLDRAEARRRVGELSDRYGLNVDPDARIDDITVGMQQRVEILKVLYRNADIIILDEPTAVLTPQEIDELIEIMKSFTREGKSVLLITHKLREIMAVADRVTVLRQGRYIATLPVAETSEEDLATLMVGRKVAFSVNKAEAHPGQEILRLEAVHVRDARELEVVKGIDLSVHAGEIVGIAGVDGNGQSELVMAIAGLIPLLSGKIYLNGREISAATVRQRNEAGLAHIPSDRQKHGLILSFSMAENMIMKRYFKEPYATHGLMHQSTIMENSERLMEQFDVRSGEGANSLAGTLSGGNQQKAIIAREYDTRPELLLAAQPTRGLDVGAIEFIHRRLVDLRDAGKAVLLVSFELDEIMDLSDRIAVMYEGHISGIVKPQETNERELGLMMSGSLNKQEAW